MNPSGDFGKKELSPALRNRFTEIWCEASTGKNDLIAIIERNLSSDIVFGECDSSTTIANNIIDFIDWFRNTSVGKRYLYLALFLCFPKYTSLVLFCRYTISIRDILTWVNFINISTKYVHIGDAYIHGACLVFLDSLGSGVTGTERYMSPLMNRALLIFSVFLALKT